MLCDLWSEHLKYNSYTFFLEDLLVGKHPCGHWAQPQLAGVTLGPFVAGHSAGKEYNSLQPIIKWRIEIQAVVLLKDCGLSWAQPRFKRSLAFASWKCSADAIVKWKSLLGHYKCQPCISSWTHGCTEKQSYFPAVPWQANDIAGNRTEISWCPFPSYNYQTALSSSSL